ncbi:unnamed protein product [Clonostachys byssicola]|uniref:Zn(2)-C6 fungal-type domain-containing protein n=1 Tax=Clonostachys byssicola TaxID=160290 RepID=A0A9N9U1L0_9HYPO|nr:unnamed protein product [Clonostachys byssicola]
MDMNIIANANANAHARLPACEPCRKSKLACDHRLPSCTRCERSGKGEGCTYRQDPFKRRRTNNDRLSPRESISPLSDLPTSTSTPPAPNASYPNPGYLGYSSHRSIFLQISPDETIGTSTEHVAAQTGVVDSHRPHHNTATLAKQGAEILERALTTFDGNELKALIHFWTARGISLALAEPFVGSCCEAFVSLGAQTSATPQWFMEQSRALLANSMRLLDLRPRMSAADFIFQTSGEQLRWESLGIFFTAVVRATFDVPFFPTLYKDDEERSALRKFAARLSDDLLDLALSLDCLNDFQIVLQYENFIIHSHVNGDHSYQSWRKLGDVIASIYALGYHQKIDTGMDDFAFLSELRKTVLARMYSADKNVAIFLGRPPRMTKRFCVFQTPLSTSSLDPTGQQELDMYTWPPNVAPSYRAETRWSALCAFQKEEILELLSVKKTDNVTRKAKLTGPLKDANGDAFKKDFLASLRLNYLHVLFMLRLACQDLLVEPGDAIVDIAEDMLGLVTDAIILRDKLANSGTGLAWKVTYYGLPATGVILLQLLRRRRHQDIQSTIKPAVLRNLQVFVAEVENGAVVQNKEANFALLSQAVQTVKIFLDSLTWSSTRQGPVNDGDFGYEPGPTQDLGSTMVSSVFKSRRRGDFDFILDYRTRWNDNDMYNHMNNTVYNALFDSVINAYLIQECGLDPATSPQYALVASSHTDFLSSIAYPVVAELALRVDRLGKSSVSYEVAIFERHQEDVKAVGRFVHVFVDRATGKPRPSGMPDQVRKGLERILSEAAASQGGVSKL